MITPSTAPTAPSVERALRHNHEWISSLLGEAIDVAAADDRVSTRMIFAIFARRLRRHLEVEDELLTLLVARSSGKMDANIEELVEEHEQISCTLDRISDELEGDGHSMPPGPADHGARRALSALQVQLEAHESKEGVWLYRACDEVLSAADRVSAIRALDRRIFGRPER